jgi:hypothetical protein
MGSGGLYKNHTARPEYQNLLPDDSLWIFYWKDGWGVPAMTATAKCCSAGVLWDIVELYPCGVEAQLAG